MPLQNYNYIWYSNVKSMQIALRDKTNKSILNTKWIINSNYHTDVLLCQNICVFITDVCKTSETSSYFYFIALIYLFNFSSCLQAIIFQWSQKIRDEIFEKAFTIWLILSKIWYEKNNYLYGINLISWNYLV